MGAFLGWLSDGGKGWGLLLATWLGSVLGFFIVGLSAVVYFVWLAQKR